MKQFAVVGCGSLAANCSNSMVIAIDGDSVGVVRPDFSSVDLGIDQVKAIVITGTSSADLKAVVETVLDLCDRIRV